MMQKSLRRIVLFNLAAALAVLSAGAQSASFIVAQNGKPVGTADITSTSTPKGYDTTSVVRVAMQGLNYNISKTERLSSDNHLRHVQLSATVNNSAVNITAAPDSAQFLVNISANGRSSTTRLDLHPAAVFLADFDPGALDTLLALAVTHNNGNLWAIIPKQSPGPDGSRRSGQAGQAQQAAYIAPIQLATYADEQGTLDGNPIAVHHLVATISGTKTELFSGPENQLLQAELPQLGFAVVRKGFVLTPPAKPGVPPAE